MHLPAGRRVSDRYALCCLYFVFLNFYCNILTEILKMLQGICLFSILNIANQRFTFLFPDQLFYSEYIYLSHLAQAFYLKEFICLVSELYFIREQRAE